MRSHKTVKLKAVLKDIFDTARRIAGQRNAKVHIKAHEEYQAFKISHGEPFLAFMDAIYIVSGIRPEHTVTGGGSDANIFNRHGIMTLNLSNGMQKVHSHDEFIRIADLVNGSRIVAAAISDFFTFKT